MSYKKKFLFLLVKQKPLLIMLSITFLYLLTSQAITRFGYHFFNNGKAWITGFSKESACVPYWSF